jgi:hypothetical protein
MADAHFVYLGITAETQDVRKNPQRLTVECIYRRIVKFRARAEL